MQNRRLSFEWMPDIQKLGLPLEGAYLMDSRRKIVAYRLRVCNFCYAYIFFSCLMSLQLLLHPNSLNGVGHGTWRAPISWIHEGRLLHTRLRVRAGPATFMTFISWIHHCKWTSIWC
ncbi:hypothetical protein SUGI_0413460 [Cryptomeria japonica]|nr:hypothetical protein SUGI_0413460 [Cryptomeria japonica]